MKTIEILDNKTKDILKKLEDKSALIDSFVDYVKNCGDVWMKDAFYSYKYLSYKDEYRLTVELKTDSRYRIFDSLRTVEKLELIEDIEEHFNNL